MGLAAGTLLGRYEVRSKIGAGGMGEVYLAQDTQLRRPVALKLLPDSATADESRLRRFEQEAYAVSALNHPNIVTIHEIGEAEACRFVVMEFIEGRTLREIADQPLPLESVAQLGKQIAEALRVAHTTGIVHRDIKPDNVMVREDGYVKVLDFGLARLIPTAVSQPEAETIIVDDGLASPQSQDWANTEPGTILGTLRYMSPEQVRGEQFGSATDIFSLGIVLYELATRQHPFAANSQLGVVHAIVSQPLIPPSRLNLEVSPSLEALILQMLERDARLRPSAAEVAAVLAGLGGKSTDTGTRASILPVKRHTVGREKERAELRTGFRSAAAGHGLLLCVAGEPGIGKTTLIEDFLAEAGAGDQPCSIARGRCSERLAGAEAYLPILEALESLLHGETGAASARVMKLIAPTWYVQLAPVSADDSSAARLITDVRAASQERMKWELGALLLELSRLRTLILFFDDLHWADVSTVDLLAYLAGRLETMRILIVAAYRSSELLLSKHPFLQVKLDLQARGVCREVPLEFLSLEDTERYLALEFPENRFPAEFIALIHTKTEGSPLFMVDLVRYLRCRKVIAEEQGRWALAKSVPNIEHELPESVRSMIQRKIEQLSEADRRLLVGASVQGYEFDSAVVARALAMDVAEVEERLEVLDRVNAFVRFVDEEEFPERTLTLRYRFVHVLYQNALYASLRPTRKAALSTAVAHALQGYYGERSSEVAPQLAFLFKAARDFAHAAEYFLVAARSARRVFANQEAIVFYRGAIEMVSQLLRGEAKPSENWSNLAAQLYEDWGDALEVTGQHDDARDTYEKALAHAPGHNRIWQSRLYRKIGNTWQIQRRYDEALRAYDAAETGLGHVPAEAASEWWQEWVQIQLDRIYLYYWMAKTQEMLETAEKARPAVEQYGAEIQRGKFFQALTLYHLRSNRYVASAEALEYSRLAAEAVENSDDMDEVVPIRFMLGFSHLWNGNLSDAEHHLQTTLTLAEKIGHVVLQSRCLTYLTITYRRQGRVEEVRQCARRALAVATEGQMMEYVATAKANLAWVARREGNFTEAQQNGRAALEMWEQLPKTSGSLAFYWTALWPLIGVALAQDQISEAVEYARGLLDPKEQPQPDALKAIIEEAIGASDQGQREKAKARLNRAAQMAGEIGYL